MSFTFNSADTDAKPQKNQQVVLTHHAHAYTHVHTCARARLHAHSMSVCMHVHGLPVCEPGSQRD